MRDHINVIANEETLCRTGVPSAGTSSRYGLLPAFVLAIITSGCAQTPAIAVRPDLNGDLAVENVGFVHNTDSFNAVCNDIENAIITFDRQGTYAPISVTYKADPNGQPVSCSQPLKLADFVKNIRSQIKDTSEVLFVIHGGLVTRSKGITEALAALHVMHHDDKSLPSSIYPIFLNWYSGGVDAYRDQVMNVREGQATWHVFAKITSPIKLATDLATGLAGMPSAATLEGRRLSDLAFLKGVVDDCSQDYAKDAPGIELLCPGSNRSNANPVERVTYPLATPVRIVTAPIIEGPGKSAWENMKRRTQNPFWREKESCIHDHACLERGDLHIFLDDLAADLADKRISIIGHSMGAIVANEMIREFPDLKYKDIVFMGGAARISDILKTIGPLLRRQDIPDAHLYNLSLLPSNEAKEMTFAGLLPSGSLLEWIDEIYESPSSLLERTVGKWDNLRGVLPVMSEHLNQNKITINVFGSEPGEPMVHGQFNDVSMCFWQSSFWRSANQWSHHHDNCEKLRNTVTNDDK